MGRTGSSYLCDLLNSHSSINCLYEIFKDERPSEPTLFADNKLAKHTAPVRGFKILENQLKREQHKHFAENKDFKHILLKRKNPIKRLASLKLAQKTGTWHLDHQITPSIFERGLKDILMFKYSARELGEKFIETLKKLYEKFTYKPELITITKAELEASIKREDEYHQAISSACSELKIIYYEDLCENYEATIRELLAFLGLSFEELLSSRAKIDHHPLSERLSNFESLKAELSGIEVEVYLRD